MAIRIRVYPQYHSVGARRTRAIKRQQVQLIQQQRLFQAQQLRLQQQAILQAQQGVYGGYGSYGLPQQTSIYGSSYGSSYGTYGTAGYGYGVSYASPAYYGGSLVTPGLVMYPGGISTTQQLGIPQGGFPGQYAYPC